MKKLLMMPVLIAGLWLSSSHLKADVSRWLPAAGTQAAAAGQTAPSSTDRDPRMDWWREARFGMFIHWGLYAVPAGEYKGKRVEGHRRVDHVVGEHSARRVRAVRAAVQPGEVRRRRDGCEPRKEAGMKYIVITSKHHDGFAMFDSDGQRLRHRRCDALQEGPDAGAGRRSASGRESRFAFYYSIMDWHHPSQYVDAPGKDPTAGDRQTKMREGRKQEYVDYMKAQLRELITKYDPAVLWFDGEWVDWWTEEDGQELYEYVRGLKPDIIINNRVGKGRKGMEGLSKTDRAYAGDFGTPEQQIPAVRPSGRRLGKLHDDERHVGVQVVRRELEVARDARFAI